MVNKPDKQVNVSQPQAQTTYSYKPPTGSDPLGEFEQNHRSYQLFRMHGLDKIGSQTDAEGKPIETYTQTVLDKSIFLRQRQFLNNVDPSKGPIQTKVDRLERRKDPDGEHLVIHCSWNAKDFMGNDISVDGIKEGIYNDPVTRSQIVRGKTIKSYTNWVAKYDIPFTKEAVDEALEGQYPEQVIYMVRLRTTRDDTLSLEQFRDTTWEEVQAISKSGKGLNK